MADESKIELLNKSKSLKTLKIIEEWQNKIIPEIEKLCEEVICDLESFVEIVNSENDAFSTHQPYLTTLGLKRCNQIEEYWGLGMSSILTENGLRFLEQEIIQLLEEKIKNIAHSKEVVECPTYSVFVNKVCSNEIYFTKRGTFMMNKTKGFFIGIRVRGF